MLLIAKVPTPLPVVQNVPVTVFVARSTVLPPTITQALPWIA